jgi:hypothetical protein
MKMKVVIYSDNTLPIALVIICKILNSIFHGINFKIGTERLIINASKITVPEVYRKLPNKVLNEIKKYDLAILCTNISYVNKYFWESDGNTMILSFNDWNLYTDLPIPNGLLYFIASILADEKHLGETHEENIGCLNDFWWDKTGINSGMRASYICGACRESYQGDPQFLEELQNLLDLISSASRMGKDVISMDFTKLGPKEKTNVVFLCHNGIDKPIVRVLNEKLKQEGIVTWFDEDQLSPGQLWQDELELQLDKISKVCVFVGKNGMGPWQSMEIRGFLSEFVERGCIVIPVILPDSAEVPKLPLFLRQMMWADLRNDYEKNIQKLIRTLKLTQGN